MTVSGTRSQPGDYQRLCDFADVAGARVSLSFRDGRPGQEAEAGARFVDKLLVRDRRGIQAAWTYGHDDDQAVDVDDAARLAIGWLTGRVDEAAG